MRGVRAARGIAVAAVLVVTAAVVTGCSDGDAPDPGLHATLQRSTLFETQRALRLALTATGDQDVQIDGVQLRTPLFEPVEPDDRDPRVRAGGPGVVLPLPYGPARCGDRVTGEAAGAPPELLTRVDGEEVRVAVDPIPSGMLRSLRARECEAAAVREEVDLRLGGRWEEAGLRTVSGEVELTQRHDGVTAAVDEVEGNLIFSVTLEGSPEPWLAVSDDEPTVRIPVTVSAARCDPHAIIEYKRKYVFTAWVRLGDDEPVRVDLHAEGDARRLLEAQMADCLT